MAVDTRNKRFSMIGFGSTRATVFPNPDGTLNVYDRAQYLWLYAGLDITYTAPAVPSCRIFTVPLESRVFSIESESRIFPIECLS